MIFHWKSMRVRLSLTYKFNYFSSFSKLDRSTCKNMWRQVFSYHWQKKTVIFYAENNFQSVDPFTFSSVFFSWWHSLMRWFIFFKHEKAFSLNYYFVGCSKSNIGHSKMKTFTRFCLKYVIHEVPISPFHNLFTNPLTNNPLFLFLVLWGKQWAKKKKIMIDISQ